MSVHTLSFLHLSNEFKPINQHVKHKATCNIKRIWKTKIKQKTKKTYTRNFLHNQRLVVHG